MSVARLWERILQVHGRTDPRLWASAAHFHLNEGARAQARVALSKLQTERQALKMAMKKVRRLRKSPTCPQEFIALGMFGSVFCSFSFFTNIQLITEGGLPST